MKFTFGIITNGSETARVKKIVQSILDMNIPEDSFEIIIVGENSNLGVLNTRSIQFNENVKPLWITKKKNLITKNAKFENIVYLHDYIAFDTNWYSGFLEYGNDFKICMTQIRNSDGGRYRDWMIWAGHVPKMPMSQEVKDDVFGGGCFLLPYEVNNPALSKYMYFSGAYWVAKKHVMEEFPLDESKIWGQGEDVQWSYQINTKYHFSINPKSSVTLIKDGKIALFSEMNHKHIQLMNSIT